MSKKPQKAEVSLSLNLFLEQQGEPVDREQLLIWTLLFYPELLLSHSKEG